MGFRVQSSYGDIEVLGVYRVPMSLGLLRDAWKSKSGGESLAGLMRTLDLGMKLHDMRTAVLIEVLVNDPLREFDIAAFGQSDFDQVPFDEVYLSLDGESVIGKEFEQPSDRKLRVAFFLSSVNPDQPLRTSFGPVSLPPARRMPGRLRRLAPYAPTEPP